MPIILDIETIPKVEYLLNPPEWFTQSKFNPQPKLEDLSKYVKEETKEKYRKVNEEILANFDAEKIKQLSINPLTCEIVSYAIWKSKSKDIGCDIYISEHSLSLLAIDLWNNLPLITFNGKGFDLPVLVISAIRLGNPQLVRKFSALITSPWEFETHIDLACWSEHIFGKKYLSLDELGHFLGCKIEKVGSGNEIYEWSKAGELDKIQKHNIADVLLTKEIALKTGLI